MKKKHNYALIMRVLVNLIVLLLIAILFHGLLQLISFRFAVVFSIVSLIYAVSIINFILNYHLHDQGNS